MSAEVIIMLDIYYLSRQRKLIKNTTNLTTTHNIELGVNRLFSFLSLFKMHYLWLRAA